ncbi:MAG TPA: methyltransferase, partial [Gemmatimonadaceae bacterium]|nr:methyltransferase [Gemmatimonadaceae bacterium]
MAELTSGSGLVGLHLLGLDLTARLLGLDIDKEATRVASRNAQLLGVSSRTEFVQSDLWSDDAVALLSNAMPQLLVCNPPYIPEPPDGAMEIEAGAGPNGTAHLVRALELTDA